MTNVPDGGWPGAPPPQGHGSGLPGPGQQRPEGQHPQAAPGAQPYPSGPAPQFPGQPSAVQPYPIAPLPGQPAPPPYDPRRSLAPGPPPSVSIDQFAPPPNRTPLMVTIAAVVVLVVVIVGGTLVRPSSPGPSPSPSPSSSVAGPGQPFTSPDGRQSGRWEILAQSWTSEGLQLQVRVHADKGPISFSFMAFSNAGLEVVDPTASPDPPDIRRGVAQEGRPETGFVFFPMERGDATIILATGGGRQMSALPVKG